MKRLLILLASMAWLAASAPCASAQALVVVADQAFRPALDEILPVFTEKTGFEVQLSSGRSPALAERIIRADIPADVFFPASEDHMQQVMEKGLVDVSLKRNILVMPSTEPAAEGIAPETKYTSAAVLNGTTNRLQAMAFLEFLVSEPARAAFARQGFALP